MSEGGRAPAEAPICRTCGQPAALPRCCSACGQPFCGHFDERGRGRCGYRRDCTTEADERTRVDYRCRGCAGWPWRTFGADWRELRPLATVVGAWVAICLAFWGAVVLVVVNAAPLLGIR